MKIWFYRFTMLHFCLTATTGLLLYFRPLDARAGWYSEILKEILVGLHNGEIWGTLLFGNPYVSGLPIGAILASALIFHSLRKRRASEALRRQTATQISVSPSRRSILSRLIKAIHLFIASTMAAIAGTVTTRTSFLKPRQDWLEVGPLNKIGTTPQPFDVAYVRRHGWKTEEQRMVVYAYKTSRGQVKVLSSVCTHLGCRVRWDKEKSEFECPCHGGLYNAQGKVVGGPPSRDLLELEVKIQQDKVLIQRA